ncbi:MAG TPA: hypothetical protein VES59_09125 [Bacteroidota bacterium]|nr:hypothetical protein [Bacteroidota bacterium]
MIRGNKRLFFFLSVLILLFLSRGSAQPPASANLQSLVDDVIRNSVADRMAPAAVSEEDVREWRIVFALLRERSLDKCRRILAKYDYQLLQIPAPKQIRSAFSARYQTEGMDGNYYDVLRENSPLKRGWGTLVFNRNRAKRLYVHVPHPIHDGTSAVMGAELFQSLSAECLMISGTDRADGVSPFDVVTLKRSMFEKWHEMLTDLVHLSLSVHGYAARVYPHPIDTTDIVVSNGRTTDEQWGISQISLSVRDTLKASGFRCALAMYDSGYARLAGAANRQGRFSNDSVGFGHWLNLEFSERFRINSPDYSRLVGALDRALAVTGQKISQQMNRAFGLVSPRVLRVDSEHRLLFPPPSDETYRIISFDSRRMEKDTLDIRFGNWVELKGSSRKISSISRLDSSQPDFLRELRHRSSGGRPPVITRIIERPATELASRLDLRGSRAADALPEDSESAIDEPLQVQRIPLEPLLSSTITSDGNAGLNPYRWQGGSFSDIFPALQAFRRVSEASFENGIGSLEASPHVLIPVLNKSYGMDGKKFIGVQMTSILVNQIARLVPPSPRYAAQSGTSREIALMAEQDQKGKFFLRIFPRRSASLPKVAQDP